MTDLMAIASAALGLTLSEPVPLVGSDLSSVLRCRTSANGSVVVKSYPASATGKEGFAAECAGLAFIAGTGAGPDLLAADAEQRVVVMSDLGTAPSLADLLLGAAWTLHAMTYLLDRSVVADESMNSLASHAPTRRQLLRYRWQRLGEELDQAGELRSLSALMSNLLEATQSWHAPGLPLYPAFR